MVEENKCCNEVMKKLLTKDLWWIKEIMNILRTLLNVQYEIILKLMVILK